MNDNDELWFAGQLAGVWTRWPGTPPLSRAHIVAYWQTLRHLTRGQFTDACQRYIDAGHSFAPPAGVLLTCVPGYVTDGARAAKIYEKILAGGWMMGVGWTRGAPDLDAVEREALKRSGGMMRLLEANADAVAFAIKTLAGEMSGARGELLSQQRKREEIAEAKARGQIEAKVTPIAMNSNVDIRDFVRDLANGTAIEVWPAKEAKQ